MIRHLAAAGLILAWISAPLRAWDPVGHQLVCQIAEDNLTPAARAGLAELLPRFNAKQTPDAPYTIQVAGCWMDDVRARTQDFNAWHYVTMPFTPDGEPVPVGSAEAPHVLWGIEKCRAIAAGRESDPAIDRDQAIIMLMHLIADVHQPLHTLSRGDDLGGNRVKVANLRDPAVDLIFSRGGNLHYFWDSAYRREWRDNFATVRYEAPLYERTKPVAGHLAASELVSREAAALQKKYPVSRFPKVGEPLEWAKESHRLGYEIAYGKLPEGSGNEPVRLTKSYVDEARAIAEERIALAGYRLAYVLNGIFAAPPAAEASPTATP